MMRTNVLAMALDPALIMEGCGLDPDPWQRKLLLRTEKQIALNCSRQSGKSTVVATMALAQALHPGSLILLLSRSRRQSEELFRKVQDQYYQIGKPIPLINTAPSLSRMEFGNGSRIIGLPGKEENIRSFSAVSLAIVDEASRVPDALYYAIRPMLRVSGGRVVLLSTPFGQRGFFWKEWVRTDEKWYKVAVKWNECPRIKEEDIEDDMRSMGKSWVNQEYNCSFEALAGAVYPEFFNCIIDFFPIGKTGKLYGGIDFGWRNPFAAVWGFLTDQDVLYITLERYKAETPISDHARALPRDVMWFADPSGRTEIAELRRQGLLVRKADNSIREGIALVNARIETGKLKVLRSCSNLISESELYRYPDKETNEIPVDENNHAMDALRYLVARIDHCRLGRMKQQAQPPIEQAQKGTAHPRWKDPEIWTRVN